MCVCFVLMFCCSSFWRTYLCVCLWFCLFGLFLSILGVPVKDTPILSCSSLWEKAPSRPRCHGIRQRVPLKGKSSARIPQSGWVLVFWGERYGFCIFVGLQRPDVLIGVGKVRSFAWLLGFWRLEGICSIGQFLNGEHAATCLGIDPQDVAHKRPVSYRGGCVFFLEGTPFFGGCHRKAMRKTHPRQNHMAVRQNQCYHFGVGAPSILVAISMFSGGTGF